MGIICRRLKKRNIYKKEKFPYDMGRMQEYAQSQGKAIHELSSDEIAMFVLEKPAK